MYSFIIQIINDEKKRDDWLVDIMKGLYDESDK